MTPSKPITYIAPMLAFTICFLILSRYIELPSASAPLGLKPSSNPAPRPVDPFVGLIQAFARWEEEAGCQRFRDRHGAWRPNASAVQGGGSGGRCEGVPPPRHVAVLVKGWTWIPDNLDNLYSCGCGLSCLWTKSPALADRPDAVLFETTTPPATRHKGDPLRVYMDLEAMRKRSGVEDIFVGYHAEDDVQCTYAGSLFHNNRNHHVSSIKRNDILVYWSSSRCLPERNQLAKSFLSLVPHHSFGKCLNNVGGMDRSVALYPECANNRQSPNWWDHLHCAMSQYKFVLAIENTMKESYVTEKLYYALDAGSVPIYFGAPNVWDFIPPNSIIDGSKFASIKELATYVKALANDPVGYAEYHAWRRCGVLGNYGRARAASLDTLPCRLCEFIRRKGGRDAAA